MKYHTIDGDIEEKMKTEMPESTIFDKIISKIEELAKDMNKRNYFVKNVCQMRM